MAEFYSEIQGNRGAATRMGSKGSGVRGELSTWQNIITVRQFTTVGDDAVSGHLASINLRGGLSSGRGTVLHVVFDADSVIANSDHPDVEAALQDVKDAFDTLDIATKLVAEQRDRSMKVPA